MALYDPYGAFGSAGGASSAPAAPTFPASPAINQLQLLAKTMQQSAKTAFPAQSQPQQAGPAVPSDGAMQPTIGPGAVPGGSPLVALLQRLMPQGGGSPLAGNMPQAGMLAPQQGPTPPAAQPQPDPQLPMDINPMNQY